MNGSVPPLQPQLEQRVLPGSLSPSQHSSNPLRCCSWERRGPLLSAHLSPFFAFFSPSSPQLGPTLRLGWNREGRRQLLNYHSFSFPIYRGQPLFLGSSQHTPSLHITVSQPGSGLRAQNERVCCCPSKSKERALEPSLSISAPRVSVRQGYLTCGWMDGWQA